MNYCDRHKLEYDEKLWCPMCEEDAFGDWEEPEDKQYYQTVEKDMFKAEEDK